MLCFADIGSKITITGGIYSYIEVVFGRYFGFIAFGLIMLSNIAAIGALANGLTGIISHFFPFFKTDWVRIIFILFLFTSLAIINIRGVRQGIAVVKFNTVIKLVPLLFIGIGGWFFISLDNLVWEITPGISELGKTSVMLIFAFIGAETALSISGEITNPQKTIPRSILISIFIVVALYMLIQGASQGVLGDSLATYTEAPLAAVAEHMLGAIGGTIIFIGAFFSIFGSLSGVVLNVPRVIYASAVDKVIPVKQLEKTHPRFKTPYVAIMLFSVIGVIVSISGNFKSLAVLSGASILLVYLGVVLALIRFKKTGKIVKGSFNVPGGYVIPALSSVFILWFLSNLGFDEQIGIAIYIVGLNLIYFLIRFYQKKIKHQN